LGTKATEPFERIAEKVDYYPSFSPDGQQIAYVQQPTYDHGTLWLRDLRTGKTRTLDAQAWGLATPFFHPDGHALIFVSSRTGIASLWRIDLPDGKPRQITNIGIEVGSGLPDHFVPPPFMARLIWAGNWIAFDASDSLWILRDDGSMARSIANESPRWFRWYKPGHSVSYQLSSGSQITYNIPAQ
jgi:WD40 repeat protein